MPVYYLAETLEDQYLCHWIQTDPQYMAPNTKSSRKY